MSKGSKKISAIDLFCGAGGLTSGLRKSEINVVAGIDIATECKFAYESNNPGSIFIDQDVADLTGERLQTLWGGAELRLLAGCAPCQPFSNYRQAHLLENDNRYPLMSEFERLIGETLPEYVTMENVPNVCGKEVFLNFIRKLTAYGYVFNFEVVKCEEIGLPQRRRRLVLLATLRGSSAPAIEKVGKKVLIKEAFLGLESIPAGGRSSKDRLHRTASLSKLNLKRIRKSKQGGTWKDWPISLRSPCHRKSSGAGYTPVYGRLDAESLAPTVTTQCYNYGSGRFGHPNEDRPISMREAAILQGFEVDYQFEPPESLLSIRDIAKMIGNAVPVNLGYAIGRAIQNHAKSKL